VTFAFSQADSIINEYKKYLQPPFISDGQQYKALITNDETAEFKVTFYGGSIYRIVCCKKSPTYKIFFTLYDKERNLLFSSKNYNYPEYWDFKFASTLDCIIELEFDSKIETSGLAMLLIGFKKNQ
jgi:hypothetical protein